MASHSSSLILLLSLKHQNKLRKKGQDKKQNDWRFQSQKSYHKVAQPPTKNSGWLVSHAPREKPQILYMDRCLCNIFYIFPKSYYQIALILTGTSLSLDQGYAVEFSH